MSLLTIEEPLAPASAVRGLFKPDHPLWRLGFRPFYLLAALLAALAVPLWAAHYLGWIGGARLDLGWHMHEMVFGVAIAVIVGFLFTAARAWTGLWTPRGGHLAALALVWIAGRVAMLAAPPLAAALVDLLFLPLAAWPLYRVLRRAGNTRNLFLPGLLCLLALANASFHAARLGWLALPLMAPVEAAILVVVLMESVIGARVIPMFTRNGAPGSAPVVHPRRDNIALALTAGTVLGWIGGLPAPAFAGLAFAAACATAVRLAGWQPQRTLGVPLLWILHLSYAWIPVGFLLLALAAMGAVSNSAAFHALAAGSMGGLIIGMMTRTALGHTGRPLKAGKAETAMFWLVQLGALVRLCAALGPVALRPACLAGAALAWALAFALYLTVYGPYLFKIRLDGKEG